MNKHKTRNRKDILSLKCFSCPLKMESDISSKKTENLINYKSSLESLLSKIKKTQIEVLSNKKSTNVNIKKILMELSENLKNELNIKKVENKKLENEIHEKKAYLQNKIFNVNNTEQVKNNNINNIHSEILSLKTLNFIAENQLNKINDITLKKLNEYNYISLCMKFNFIEEKEIICNKQKYYDFASKLLHNKINDTRKKLKLIVSHKENQNDEIESTNQNLTQLKNYISKIKNGYMNNKEIIQEESKEFTQSIILTKIQNNINNIMKTYNKKKQNVHKYNNNIIIINSPDDDDESFNNDDYDNNDNDELSIPSIKEKDKDVNINNNIQQFISLNMNINFNVKCDKTTNKENIMYNSERNNSKNNDILNNNKRKKGLSSTGSLPNFIVNCIQDEIIEIPKNINNMDNICKYRN